MSSSQDDAYDDNGSIRLIDTRTGRVSIDPHQDGAEVIWNGDEADERQRLIENANVKGRSSVESDGEFRSDQDFHHLHRKDSGEDVHEHIAPILESRTSSFEGVRPNSVMGNGAARRSLSEVRLHSIRHGNGDVHVQFDADEEDLETSDGVVNGHIEGVPMRTGGSSGAKPKGLQAKSGIIIVRLYYHVSIPTSLNLMCC